MGPGFAEWRISRFGCLANQLATRGTGLIRAVLATALFLPLVGREWKNGSNSSYNCTTFLHSLLTKGKSFEWFKA